MGKIKPRLKNNKGKRWPKGQSSNSNPIKKKYREKARLSFFAPTLGTNSALTIGALKTLDAFNRKESSVKSVNDDASSYSAVSDATSSAKTFASDWSHCSNMSFNKLLQNFQPSSAHHKEMLATLAAVSEVIKDKGGNETSTEYYAALMTTLEASESEESVAAVISLISMGIKSVPEEVLRKTFSVSSKTFVGILEKYSALENQIILRSCIGCLSVLLRAQDKEAWSYSSTLDIFRSILVFSIYTKPKVRKYSQHAVCAILKGSKYFSEEDLHPAAECTAKFCIQQIESGVTLRGGTTTLHILQLLKEVLHTFPRSQIKITCEMLLKLLTLGNMLVTSCSFQALHGLFIANPPANRLVPALNGQLINALYEYQPPASDWNTSLAWLAVMQEAYLHLVRKDHNLCAEHLIRLFKTLTDLWLSDNVSLLNGVTLTLRTVAMDCIPKCKVHWNYSKIAQSIFEIVENGMKYQYRNAWCQVLSLLSTLFEVLSSDKEPYFLKCLKSLGELRDSYDFPHSVELENTVGKAIRFLGPEIVLQAIPLEVTGKEANYEFRRSWLLPLLRENVHSSTLKFFVDYFLSLATLCKRKVEELEKVKDTVGIHSYALLQSQIWGLLPSFCNDATDIKDSFKNVAKILGNCLSAYKDLRLPILSALRKLISKSQEKGDNEALQELSKYAKNYLPILFNMYTTKASGSDEEGQRLAALETIKVYLSIASQDLRLELFDRAMSHMEGENNDMFMRESVMDLMKKMIQYLDEDRLKNIFLKCLAILKNNKEAKLEKKCYRLLEELCNAESEPCKEFLKTNFGQIQKFLLKSLKKKKAASNKGARLRCILHIVKRLPKNQFHVIRDLIPEAVLCCKDMNAKCRSFAFDLLIEMFNVSKTWSTKKTNDDFIRDYIALLLGGLTGTPTLTSATVLGLAKLAYILRLEMPPDLLQLLLDNISLLTASPNREVASACLSFIKMFVVGYSKEVVLPHVPLLVKSIVSMTEDCKRHSRLKVRDILDRLLRKFGYETIHGLIPSDDTIMLKRLKNLRKINDRKKKLREAVRSEMDENVDSLSIFSAKKKPKSIEEILASSDESDMEDDVETTRSNRTNQSAKSNRSSRKQAMTQMFIKEYADDIVDLASPAAVGKLTTTKQQQTAMAPLKKKKEPHFKTASDGRLIITKDISEDEERSARVPRKRKLNDFASDDDDDYEDIDEVSDKLSDVHLTKKMKTSSASSSARSLYQAGGSGIHRPIVGKTIGRSKKEAKKKGKDIVPNIKTGKEYRAKKAKGDIKLKGKPDPYAYVPLSRKVLNKRKKAKVAGRFQSVIKSTMKGKK